MNDENLNGTEKTEEIKDLEEKVEAEREALAKKQDDRNVNCVLVFLAVLVALSFIFNLFFKRMYVSQDSMAPTILNGETIIVLKTDSVCRGDVIIFKDTEVYEDKLIKRAVAFGGEWISIADGILTIETLVNGEFKVVAKYKEPYIGGKNIVIPRTEVGEGKIYALGDNRKISYDSSEFGGISANSVIGKLVFTNVGKMEEITD